MPKWFIGISGSLGGGAVCDAYAVWLVICLSSVLKQGFPTPSSPFPHYFPWASIKLCFS